MVVVFILGSYKIYDDVFKGRGSLCLFKIEGGGSEGFLLFWWDSNGILVICFFY